MSSLHSDIIAQLDAYEWGVRRLRYDRYLSGHQKCIKLAKLRVDTVKLLYKTIKESK